MNPRTDHPNEKPAMGSIFNPLQSELCNPIAAHGRKNGKDHIIPQLYMYITVPSGYD